MGFQPWCHTRRDPDGRIKIRGLNEQSKLGTVLGYSTQNNRGKMSTSLPRSHSWEGFKCFDHFLKPQTSVETNFSNPKIGTRKRTGRRTLVSLFSRRVSEVNPTLPESNRTSKRIGTRLMTTVSLVRDPNRVGPDISWFTFISRKGLLRPHNKTLPLYYLPGMLRVRVWEVRSIWSIKLRDPCSVRVRTEGQKHGQ